MSRLELTEYWVKWIAAITVILVAIRQLIKLFIQAYKYLKGAHQHFEMFQNIIANQEYIMVVNRSIMDKLSIGYCRSDIDGNAVEISDAICNRLGFPERDLLKMGWFARIKPSQHERVMKAFKESVENKSDFIQNFDMICSDGTSINVDAHAHHTGVGYFVELKINNREGV